MNVDDIAIISDHQDSEEILRDVHKNEYYLQLSPIFPSRLKTFGGLSLTPKINLKDNEWNQLKECHEIVSSQLEKVESENVKFYETPANSIISSSQQPKLRKKSQKTVDYTARLSCKQLQFPHYNASKNFTESLSKKRRKANAGNEDYKKATMNESINVSDNLMDWSSNQQGENGNLEIVVSHPKWSPVSGCSPISNCSSEGRDSAADEELRDENLQQLKDFLNDPCVPRIITSTPVDNEARFDYSVSTISEGNTASSSNPFVLKESRFCCSSEIILSDLYSNCSDEESWPSSDKENIDPNKNRAAFDALIRNGRIMKEIHENQIKCTYKKIYAKEVPLQELISISLSQPIQVLRDEQDARLSHSQPECRPVNEKGFTLSWGLDFCESLDSDGVELAWSGTGDTSRSLEEVTQSKNDLK